jgi:hypothetical protein
MGGMNNKYMKNKFVSGEPGPIQSEFWFGGHSGLLFFSGHQAAEIR